MLKISKISPPVSTKNNGFYRKVSFRQYNEVGGLLIPTNIEKVRNVFSKNDISKEESIYTMIEEGTLKVGDAFAGNIIKYDSTPYELGDNTVTSISIVVFEGENGEALADKSLKANYASIVVNGAIRTDAQRTKPVGA